MSSRDCSPEKRGPQPASAPKPPSQAAKETNQGGGSEMDRMLREKLRALGKLPPAPPPRPLETALGPRGRELLQAGGELIYERMGRWLIKHACGTKVTKSAPFEIRPSEVEAMRFVLTHTSIPVPRVYDVGEKHFTMEFIRGETLMDAWNKLSTEDRALVCCQLRGYVNQFRAIESPDGRICSFGGGPAVDSRRMFCHNGGPFPNEAAYNDFLVSDLWAEPVVRDMIRTQLRTGHEIVLSHGDLHAVNIIVQPGVGIVAILDWELAGYYPEYHDLVKPLRGPSWQCGYYKELLLNIFPQRYEAEFVVDQLLTMYSKH